MIRFFDIIFSIIGLVILSPIFIVLYLLIRIESKGGGFYSQERIGKNGKPFKLYKFRSMRIGSDKGANHHWRKGQPYHQDWIYPSKI